MNSNIFKGRFSHEHTTDGTPCWCKQRVAITFDGKKIGDGTVDPTGSLVMTITSDEVIRMLSGGEVQNLSVSPTYKS